MIRLHLITGFLGSGKTTLLQHVLQTGVRGEKVALVVNEIGEVGIDGAILEREGYAMSELTSGCICCEVRGDLVRALMAIATDEAPDRIFVETTGAAEPGKLLQFLYGSGELLERMTVEPVLAVVDVSNFNRLMGPIAFLTVGQIKAADLVLLNKLDLVDEATAKAVEQRVASLNPRAVTVRTSHCQVDLGALLREVDAPAPPSAPSEPLPDHDHSHATAIGLTTFVHREEAGLQDPDSLEERLRRLPNAVLRLKGFVRTAAGPRLLNYVSGAIHWHPAPGRDPSAATELVVIGHEMDEGAVRKILAG